MTILEFYMEKAREFAKRNSKPEISNHIAHIIASVVMNRDEIITDGGSFVQAILSNNLSNAIGYADTECINNIKLIVLAHHNMTIEFHEIPANIVDEMGVESFKGLKI
jgi:hypothetical protein